MSPFDKLGIKVIININNRKLLNDLLATAGVGKEKLETAILSIDKLEKFGLETVKKDLKEKKIDNDAINNIIKIIKIPFLKSSGLTGNAIYDIDYANVNEVTIQIPEKNSVDIIFSSVKRVNLFYDGSQGSVANFRIGNLGVLKFNLGETKRADLDNDGKAETEITFMQIVNKNAEINIKKIESGCLPSWYCEEWDKCVNNFTCKKVTFL